MTEIKTHWTPARIDEQAAFPQKLEIVSSFYFAENEGSNRGGADSFFPITDNILGVLGDFSDGLDVFDTEKGEVLWRVRWTDTLGGRALYDNGVLYVGYQASATAACIKAHRIETGEVIWERKLTNSDEQFGTYMVQTSNRIIAPNVKKDTLFILDKLTGKLTAKLPMTNPFEGGRGVFLMDDIVFTYNDKLYILAYKESFVLDSYNPETAGFENTLFEFPSGHGKIVQILQIEGDLCLFMESGEFYRISLTDGKVKARLALGVKEKEDDYFRCFDLLYCQNKLRLIVKNRKDENTLFTYDLDTDQLEESIPVPELDKDYSIVAPTPYANTVLRYGYGEPSKNGLALYDFSKRETLSELILPQYSEKEFRGKVRKNWRDTHLVLGDAIYLIQKMDEGCMLHRIQ